MQSAHSHIIAKTCHSALHGLNYKVSINHIDIDIAYIYIVGNPWKLPKGKADTLQSTQGFSGIWKYCVLLISEYKLVQFVIHVT